MVKEPHTESHTRHFFKAKEIASNNRFFLFLTFSLYYYYLNIL